MSLKTIRGKSKSSPAPSHLVLGGGAGGREGGKEGGRENAMDRAKGVIWGVRRAEAERKRKVLEWGDDFPRRVISESEMERGSSDEMHGGWGRVLLYLPGEFSPSLLFKKN